MATYTVGPTGADYATLAAAEAAVAGSDTAPFFDCQAFTDTTAVTWAGWGSGSVITVRPGSGVDRYDPAGGYTTTNRFVHQSTTGVASQMLANAAACTLRFEGVIVRRIAGSSFNFRLVFNSSDANNAIEIDDCFVEVTDASSPPNTIQTVNVADNATTILRARNSVFVGRQGTNDIGVVTAEGTAQLYINNCVISGGGDAAYGVMRGTGTVVIKNTAIYNCATASTSGTPTIDYCATDDGAGTNGVTLGSSTEWGQSWTDYTTHDYTLVTGSLLEDEGTDLSADGNYAVTDDIQGTARPEGGAFDIGVHELAAVGGGGGGGKRLIGGNLINRSILQGRLAA